MFSTGEFSKITGLPIKTLRLYYEKGLLVPAAIDPATGYRLYDDRNIDRADIIIAFRFLAFPRNEIAEILAASSEDQEVLA